jgi:glycosyltransferase involved in cell wall biosynthesis
MTGISAVIATYRRKDELRRLLDSLIVNNCPQLEVIIADQNRDNLIDTLVSEYSEFLNIKHLKLSLANQSRARNIGASNAQYDIVCFPDDDCWFEDNALNRVLYHFQNFSDTDLLVINWKQNAIKHKDQVSLTKDEIFSFRSVGYVTYVLFFNKEAFLKLDGFVEDMGLGQYIGGGEDTEITFRAANNGLNIFYDSSIEVNHKYTEIHKRAIEAIRSRERAMGFLYAMYKVPYYVIVRGFIAPLVHMLSLNPKRWKEYYNMFLARIEGYIYAKRKISTFSKGEKEDVRMAIVQK